MKTGFSFYFRLLMISTLCCATLYAVAGKAVEENLVLNLSMIAPMGVALVGMVKHLSPSEESDGQAEIG